MAGAQESSKARHGGHGWFVTFADLMALMMSFFVMVAAYSTQDQKKLQLVAGSMRDAFGTKQGEPLRRHRRAGRHPDQDPAEECAPGAARGGRRTTPPRTICSARTASRSTAFDHGFALAAASLRQALQDMPEIAELSRTSSSTRPRKGLNVSLVDQDGRSMFPDGSDAALRPHAPRARSDRADAAAHAEPRRRSPATPRRPGPARGRPAPPGTCPPGAPSACARSSPRTGLPDDRFATVTGKADVEPMFPDNPYLAANRRVTVTLLKEAPPIPFGTKP